MIEKLPAHVYKRNAARVEEAAGLLAMLKPFLKRADKLTQAEADIFQDVIRTAGTVLSEASNEFYRARYPEKFPAEQDATDEAPLLNPLAIRRAR
jgi:hypothetical protein